MDANDDDELNFLVENEDDNLLMDVNDLDFEAWENWPLLETGLPIGGVPGAAWTLFRLELKDLVLISAGGGL